MNKAKPSKSNISNISNLAKNMISNWFKGTSKNNLPYRNTDLSKVDGNTLELLYNESKSQLNIQYQSIQNLVNRAGISLGFIGLIIATVIGFNIDSITISLFSGISLLTVSFIFALIAWFPKKYFIPPNPYNAYNELVYENSKFVKDYLTDLYGVEHNNNKMIINTKNLILKWSTVFLFIGIVLIIVYFIFGV